MNARILICVILLLCTQVSLYGQTDKLLWEGYKQAVEEDSRSAKSAELQITIRQCWEVLCRPYDKDSIDNAEKKLSAIDLSYLTDAQKEECLQIWNAISRYEYYVIPFEQKFSNIEQPIKQQLAEVLSPNSTPSPYTITALCNRKLKAWFEDADFVSYSNSPIPYLKELGADIVRRYQRLCDPQTASKETLQDFLDCEYRVSTNHAKPGIDHIAVEIPQGDLPMSDGQTCVEHFLSELPSITSLEEGNNLVEELREIVSDIETNISPLPSNLNHAKEIETQWQLVEQAQEVLSQAYDSALIVLAKDDLKTAKTFAEFQNQSLMQELDSLTKSLNYYGRKFQYDRLLQIIDKLIEEIGPDRAALQQENQSEVDSQYQAILNSPAHLSVINRAEYTHRKWLYLKDLYPLDQDAHFRPKKTYWEDVIAIRQELVSVLGEPDEE